MAKRSLLVVLTEMSEAIEGIGGAIEGRTLEEFRGDWLLRHGVQRGIEIISEASRHLPDDLLEIAPEVPWRRVRDIGNILRHEYHRISDPIVWNVAVGELPRLRLAVERMKHVIDT